MTLPALVQKHQKKVFAEKAKYSYSLISQAVALSVADNGPSKYWNSLGNSFNASDLGNYEMRTNAIKIYVEKYFAPYMKVKARGTNKVKFGYYLEVANGVTLTFFSDGNTDSNGIYTPGLIYVVPSFNNNISPYWDTTRNYSQSDIILVFRPANDKVTFFCWGSCAKREQVINESKYACKKSVVKNSRYNCGRLLQLDNFVVKDDFPW